jgi:hypothetical protein
MPRKFFAWTAFLFVALLAGAQTQDARSFIRPGPEGMEPELRLALKYVSYLSDALTPITSQLQARDIVTRINQIYSACQIQFVLEEYVAAQPNDLGHLGLKLELGSMSDLDPTRRSFDDPNRLVIINTGQWNHRGMGTPNAWTAMPGSSPSGTVIEGRVAAYPEMIAHELGHYLNLDHVKDASDLMNPIIYRTSTRLSAEQCESARSTAQTSRALALR